MIWNQEESRFNAPSGVFAIGQGMAAPTMMAWASEEDKVKHLPPLASGEHIWCQLFSEPAGGSDLAALRTQAKKDGDDWVINGQKFGRQVHISVTTGSLLYARIPPSPSTRA